jgi:hypothetical protein
VVKEKAAGWVAIKSEIVEVGLARVQKLASAFHVAAP